MSVMKCFILKICIVSKYKSNTYLSTMKLYNLYLLIVPFFSMEFSLVIPPKKICKDCIHFIGDEVECGKFGELDLITGKITYPSAGIMRNDNKKCGRDAVYYEKNNFTLITEPYFFLKGNWAGVFAASSWVILYYIILTNPIQHH